MFFRWASCLIPYFFTRQCLIGIRGASVSRSHQTWDYLSQQKESASQTAEEVTRSAVPAGTPVHEIDAAVAV